MYKEKILNLLRSSRSAFCSGEELARKCGISRTMVWKHIKALERDGFVIEAVPSQGYRIMFAPDLLRQNDITTGLKTKLIGKHIHLISETASTNTLAMDMASAGAPEGTVVIAERQTQGKGRLGRKWISPRGNLYLSVILRPQVPLHRAPLVTLMGAVAVASAIRAVCGLAAGIKWPNDILLSGKKVCGLLSEMSAEQDRIRHLVLGIGVDVNMEPGDLPADVRIVSTTLARETGAPVNRTALLQQVLRDLERGYRKFLENDPDILEEWKKMNVTVGSRVSVGGAGSVLEGLAQGVDREGRLLLRLDDGTIRTVAAGDVTILKGK